MSFLKKLFKLPNVVPIVTIVLGFATSTGLTDRWYSSDKIMIALIALLAMQLLNERLGVLDSIHETLQNRSYGTSIELLSRTDKNFEQFSDFVKNAKEVMVIGVDLAFMAKANAWFIKESLNSGMNLKLIMIDPNTSGQMKKSINNHDERNTPDSVAHDHVQSVKDVIESLKAFSNPQIKGRLEIKAREGIPSPSLTLVDPTKPNGKIRVELKLYKRNQGAVPYFMLTRTNNWYHMFFEHYYIKLWNDSKLVYDSTTN